MSKQDNSSQDQSSHKPNKNNEDARRTEQETKKITDPEESMRGPISSVMQSIKEEAEENDEEDREEAEQEAREAARQNDDRGNAKK